MVIVIKDARRAVTRDVNIRPSIIVEVECRDAESVVPVRSINVRFRRHVLKSAVALLVVQHVLSPWQSARAAHHRNTFPHAGRAFPRPGRLFHVKINIGGNKQVQFSIPVVIYKRAAGAPHPIPCNARLLADVRKSSISIIVIQDIFSVVGHKKIFVLIVVVVSNADTLSPARVNDTSFLGHIRECPVVIVVIQVIRRLLFSGERIEGSSIHHIYVRPAVVVIIENRHSGTSRFDDEFFCIHSSKRIARIQSGFSRFIDEISNFLLNRVRGMGRSLRVHIWQASIRAKKHASCKTLVLR